MIRNFEPPRDLPPEEGGRFKPATAALAGFIAGLILLLAPQGSPWSGLSFFSPVIMGRALPTGMPVSILVIWTVHLFVSVLYGLIVSLAVSHLRQPRAMIVGALAGVILYCANVAFVSLVWPEWRGNELGVLFTHAVFGLVAASAYRGLLRRRTAVVL